MPSLIFILIFLSLVSLVYPSRLSFFSSKKEPLFAPEVWSSDQGDDVLSFALSKAFPSSFQKNPAYASAFDIFRSLESKPSCHRSAAASLVLDCSALEDRRSQDGGVKISYAVQLAVCEFEATGISFPWECKNLDSKRQEIKVMKCVKKLEERPQWWTTLSNNIQSAAVMCSAVRHEVEKDQLLNLHRNITNTQESLFAALDASLNEAWESIMIQKEFAGAWKRTLEDVLGELVEVKEGAVDLMKTVGIEATKTVERFVGEIENTRKNIIEEATSLDRLTYRVRNGVETLEERSKAISKETERIYAGAIAQHKVIKGNSDLVQEVNTILSSQIGPSIDTLLHSIATLSAKVMDSLVTLKRVEDTSDSYSLLFTSLSTSYIELAQTHMVLAASLNNQEAAQERLISSLEMAHSGANITLERLLKMMGILNQSLGDADIKIRSWNINGMGQTLMPLGALTFGFGVILGREGSKVVLLLFGVLAGLLLLLLGLSHLGDLIKVFDLKSLRSKLLDFEIVSKDDTKDHGVLSQRQSTWSSGVLAVVFLVAAIVFVALRHRRRGLTFAAEGLGGSGRY